MPFANLPFANLLLPPSSNPPKTPYLRPKIKTLHSVLSITLALLILLQSFSKVWIVVGFKVNQRYIARVLCINRDKPERRCNGTCVLMQRIKAEAEQERRQLPEKLEAHKEVVYDFNGLKLPLPVNSGLSFSRKRPGVDQSPHSSDFVRSIFRPPDVEMPS